VHCHWSYRWWCGQYRCWYYWDPCCRCYYYWYGPGSCWYPVTYIVQAPPVANQVVAEVNEQVPEVPPPASAAGPAASDGPTDSTTATIVPVKVEADSEDK